MFSFEAFSKTQLRTPKRATLKFICTRRSGGDKKIINAAETQLELICGEFFSY